MKKWPFLYSLQFEAGVIRADVNGASVKKDPAMKRPIRYHLFIRWYGDVSRNIWWYIANTITALPFFAMKKKSLPLHFSPRKISLALNPLTPGLQEMVGNESLSVFFNSYHTGCFFYDFTTSIVHFSKSFGAIFTNFSGMLEYWVCLQKNLVS